MTLGEYVRGKFYLTGHFYIFVKVTRLMGAPRIRLKLPSTM
jgi:hypothetical protein